MDHDYVVTGLSSAHAEAVSELIRNTLPEALTSPSSEELSAGNQRFSSEGIIRLMNDRLAFVAVYRQRIVGAIMLASTDGSREVEAFAVSPEHRDQGVGSLLVQTAEQRAGELGIKRIAVSPKLRDNGFFRRLGYSAAERDNVLEKALA